MFFTLKRFWWGFLFNTRECCRRPIHLHAWLCYGFILIWSDNIVPSKDTEGVTFSFVDTVKPDTIFIVALSPPPPLLVPSPCPMLVLSAVFLSGTIKATVKSCKYGMLFVKALWGQWRQCMFDMPSFMYVIPSMICCMSCMPCFIYLCQFSWATCNYNKPNYHKSINY